MQTTNAILMIRPVNFRMNEQTAVNNYYQEDIDLINDEINAKAQLEFDEYVNKLRQIGVDVTVVSDTVEHDTPDSIFPNNWISFHKNASVIIYPMFAKNRRLEKREDILDILEAKGHEIKNVIDYSSAEEANIFLEGTGSILMDRVNGKAYCALSPRADEELFIEFCEDMECDPVIFTAYQTVDQERLPIYHTNVMMCLAEHFAVICLDAVDDKKERKALVKHIKGDGREIIEITEAQVNQFAGNMLQVRGFDDELYLIMSQSAYNSLSENQIKSIEKYSKIMSSPLDTIEKCGGGSARCMMAEVFLPKV